MLRLREAGRKGQTEPPVPSAVGDLDHGFACLERAFQVRSAGLIYLHVDPGYKPLRPDPASVSWWSGSGCGSAKSQALGLPCSANLICPR
jgi:hypothetical protein